MTYVVVAADSGVIEGAALFHDEANANAYAQQRWQEMTGSAAPDEESGGWHSDDYDVWLFEESFTDEEKATQSPEPAYAGMLTALKAIAEYHYDGEEIEGSDDPVEMSIDDAFEVANEAIHVARAAVEQAEKAMPMA